MTIALRQQIRIEVATRKNEEKSEIINARESDNAFFHKLIKKQRGHLHKFID